MKLFDASFKTRKLRYILQCLLAAATMAPIFIILQAMTNAGVIAAVGASAFIALTLPKRKSASPRYLIGGYIVAILVGTLCYWLHVAVPMPKDLWVLEDLPNAVFGAAAMGLASFVMVVTNTEHPPAAGLAVGLVLLDEWQWLAVVAVMAGIIGLSLAQALLKPYLEDLL